MMTIRCVLHEAVLVAESEVVKHSTDDDGRRGRSCAPITANIGTASALYPTSPSRVNIGTGAKVRNHCCGFCSGHPGAAWTFVLLPLGRGRKRQTQGTDDAHDGAEFGIFRFSPKRLIQALAVQAGILRNFTHAAAPRATMPSASRAKSASTRFERRRDIGNLAFLRCRDIRRHQIVWSGASQCPPARI